MWQAALRSSRAVALQRSTAAAGVIRRRNKPYPPPRTSLQPHPSRFLSALAHAEDLAPSCSTHVGAVTTTTASAALGRNAFPAPSSAPTEEIRVLIQTLLVSQQFAPSSVAFLDNLQAGGNNSEPAEREDGDEGGISNFDLLGSSSSVVRHQGPPLMRPSASLTEGEVQDGDVAGVAAENETVPIGDAVAEKKGVAPHPTKEDATADPQTIDYPRERPGLPPRTLELRAAISWSMNHKRYLRAHSALNAAVKEGVVRDLSKGMVRTLYFCLSREHPFEAYDVLKIYQSMKREEGDDGGEQDMNAYKAEYGRLCDSFKFLDPRLKKLGPIHRLVSNALQDMKKLNRAGKEHCYPILVAALAAQKTVTLGKLARQVYRHMIDQNFTIPDGYWEHLLTLSRFFRRHDLPYDDILERAIKAGRRPLPQIVLKCLSHLFPYDDTGSTFRMLKCILELQLTAKDGDSPYRVEITTLELIGAAAAKKGFVDMNMVIWDIADALGYEPTEFMYENTILAFCAQPNTYSKAFAVLSDMEARGMEPSSALIRSMSTHFRTSSRNLRLASKALRELGPQGRPTTTAALNAVMSTCGEHGDVDQVIALLSDFAHHNVEPNTDSFNFCFEALGKSLARKTRKSANERIIVSSLDTADYLLQAMEDKGIAPDHHIIRNYIELLCLANEVETATSVVRGGISAEDGLMTNKVLYRVAVANAELGRFDIAREIAAYASQPMRFLEQKISRLEFAKLKRQSATTTPAEGDSHVGA